MSLITNIIGGIQSSSAIGKASGALVDAANKAGQTVVDAANKGNTQIQGATVDAQGNVIDAGKTAAQGVTDASTTAAQGVTGAATTAAGNVNAAAQFANTKLDPYATAGATAVDELNTGVQAGGDFNKAPTLADLQLDPGYAFRQQQGEQAIQRSAAAHGAAQGGGILKALTDYSQGAASQEYKNAFDRFEQSTQNRFSNLNTVATHGQAAASEQGQNLGNAAVYGGNVTTGAAKYAGDTGVNAATYSGNVGVGTNEYAGTLGVGSAETQAQNSNVAATYQGDRQLDVGKAIAGKFIGKANAYNSMLSGIGGAFDNAALGYMSGGFSGAFKGLAGGTP